MQANPRHPVPRCRCRPDTSIKQADYYGFRASQGWFQLRERFRATHRAVTEDHRDVDPDSL
jgi:hypothetical protein